jgi:hypothetical protein
MRRERTFDEMGYTLDYFVAPLRCPVCGNVSPADESTNMQTKIRDNPELAYLGVGHPLEIRPEEMAASGYLTIRPPDQSGEIRILQSWECPACGQAFNWAEIVVKDGVIQSIEAVPLDRATLGRANYISDDSIYVAADLTDRPVSDLLDADVVQVLRDTLPAAA